ncbi:unnamed protein product [Zymoseptoria tritici ST99CH_1A5]|uniref:Uncharacterized protein n=1 Tax=Zymoseptoria tritici ST99CH_1A5 TaxID=1276529 RepID=A0A1Y6L3R6_ZYMTR|nr:unnamed protein product [Zymoseptoria tritici ST99CH_3D1]SMY19066.1 unnamed protein product [Zymoseptoria tritici ST99CH_1A5]
MADVANRAVFFTGTITASSDPPDATWSGVTFDPSSSPLPASQIALSPLSVNRFAQISGITSTSSASKTGTSTKASRTTESSEVNTPTNFEPTIAASTAAHQQSPALYISLIVLSTLIIVTTLVLSGLYWRRHRRRQRRLCDSAKVVSAGRHAESVKTVPSARAPPQKSSGPRIDKGNDPSVTNRSREIWTPKTIDEIVAGSASMNDIGSCSRQSPVGPGPSREILPGRSSSSNRADAIPMTPLLFKTRRTPSRIEEQ